MRDKNLRKILEEMGIIMTSKGDVYYGKHSLLSNIREIRDLRNKMTVLMRHLKIYFESTKAPELPYEVKKMWDDLDDEEIHKEIDK